MKCPHCLENFHAALEDTIIVKDRQNNWGAQSCICPACLNAVIFLARGSLSQRGYSFANVYDRELVLPRGSSRPPCPAEVPADISEDYLEACLVLNDSPKASAALSRRALQHLLRGAAGVKKSDLSNEIQELLDSGKLPSHIAENIDAIRNIGNFSAHPQKSTATGEILPVEPHEAEWTLDVLEQLFDFYYVAPAVAQAKRDALNAKLAEVGKPAMK